MIDMHDFKEWWDREQRRADNLLSPEAHDWAQKGFMAAAQAMAAHMRAQKQRERAPARLLQGVSHG